jgi:tRNA (guanine-N7-)-methyltransferase
MAESEIRKRTVRSFVRRTGRMTASQQRAMEELWPEFGIEYADCELDLDEIFGRSAERILEIGFGNGETLVMSAAASPDKDFIGIEVHEPGVGHCLIRAQQDGIKNLRVISHDAIDVLQQEIPDGSLSRINLYFPDPWPKKRHHKRRIVQTPFLDLAARKLAPGGKLCIATDWENYAEHIDEVMATCDSFRLAERREHGGEQPLDRYTTKFETRGLKKGHRIRDWQFERT